MSGNTFQIERSDVLGPSGCVHWAADFIGSKPSKFFDTTSSLLRTFRGKDAHFVADQLDTASSLLAGVAVLQDSVAVVVGMQKCHEAVSSCGFFSWTSLDEGRKFLRDVSNLTSDSCVVVKHVASMGYPVSFVRELSYVGPACDAYACLSDILDNAQSMYATRHIEANTKGELHRKYWWQNLWELNKNIVGVGVAALTLSGIILAPLVTFAIYLTGFVLSMIAMFARQEVQDYSVAQGLIKIYEQ